MCGAPRGWRMCLERASIEQEHVPGETRILCRRRSDIERDCPIQSEREKSEREISITMISSMGSNAREELRLPPWKTRKHDREKSEGLAPTPREDGTA